MNLPSPLQFKSDDFPELPSRFLDLLNRVVRIISDMIQRVPERAEALDRFMTTNSSGLGTLELKNQLATKPNHVKVTRIFDDNAPDTPILLAYVWRMVSNDTIRLSFGGLTASTKYRLNVEYS